MSATQQMTQPMQVLTSHKSADWYTPPMYVERVRLVLGSIDLDPASDALPQKWIQAKRYFTKDDDGLTHVWEGKVFLNPPYGKSEGYSNQALWSEELERRYQIGTVTEAILLINSTHGYKWYEKLWTAYPVCLVRERIRFIKPDGSVGGQAKRGQTFVLFSNNDKTLSRFCEVFQEIGRIILPRGYWNGEQVLY